MQLLYNTKAKDEGVYIVGACGFDSIPADLGIIYTEQQFDGQFSNYTLYILIYQITKSLEKIQISSGSS